MQRTIDKFLIGEKVLVDNEPEQGVVTRLSFEHGLIYVLFPRNREEIYAYPEDVDNGRISLTTEEEKDKYKKLVKKFDSSDISNGSESK
jgi:hypothetical protein